MSLFGQGSSGNNLFGSIQNNALKPSPLSGLGSSQPAQTQGTSPFAAFGSASNAQTPQPSSAFGGAAAGNAPSTPLFGAAVSTQPKPLFASAVANTAQQPSAFGSTAPPASTPNILAPSTLFAAAPAQPTQTSGLFGNTQAAPAPPNNAFGGFSLGQKPLQQQQQQSGGLFGAGLGSNVQSNAGNSLFGTSSNQTQQQSSSFLGQSTRTGGLTMGQSTSQPQQQTTIPGIKIDVSNIRGTTRFNDLHEELQKSIEQIDAFIQQQIAFKAQCDTLMPAHENNLSTIPGDVEYIGSQLETTELALESDVSSIAAVKTAVQKDAEDARTGFRAVDNLKLPQQFHYSGMWQRGSSARPGVNDDALSNSDPADLLPYFTSTSNNLSSTLEAYQGSLAEIECHLGNVERQTMAQMQQLNFRKGRGGKGRGKADQVRELQMVLSGFEGGVVRTAERVGSVREAVSELVEAGN